MRFIKDDLAEFMMKKVGREPMVIPMYVYIGKDGILSKEQPAPADDTDIQIA